MDRDVWQLALQATLQGSMRGSPVPSRRASDASALTADKFRQASAASSSLIDQSAPLLPLSETRRKETVEWLNPLIARFFQNIRVNPSVTMALKEKMSKKLMQKVSEKKLNGYLVRLLCVVCVCVCLLLTTPADESGGGGGRSRRCDPHPAERQAAGAAPAR